MDITPKDLVLLLLGAVLGVILGIALHRPLDRAWSKVTRRISWYRSRLRSEHTDEVFRVGSVGFKWQVLEGSIDQPYRHGSIRAILEGDLTLPNDIQTKKAEIAAAQSTLESTRGLRACHDGPMVSLSSFNFARSQTREDPLLTLHFLRTSYYVFMATSLQLDKPTIALDGTQTTLRDRFLSSTSFKQPVPLLATSFAVNLAVVTSDNYLLYGKRGSEGVTSYEGTFTVPINECVNPTTDLVAPGEIDLWRTAVRGAREELGIDVPAEDIVLFTLGVDPAYYFYAVTGVAYLRSHTRDYLLARRSTGQTRDQMELAELYSIKLDGEAAAKIFRETGPLHRWHPVGAVALLQTLMREVGSPSVERALK